MPRLNLQTIRDYYFFLSLGKKILFLPYSFQSCLRGAKLVARLVRARFLLRFHPALCHGKSRPGLVSFRSHRKSEFWWLQLSQGSRWLFGQRSLAREHQRWVSPRQKWETWGYNVLRGHEAVTPMRFSPPSTTFGRSAWLGDDIWDLVTSPSVREVDPSEHLAGCPKVSGMDLGQSRVKSLVQSLWRLTGDKLSSKHGICNSPASPGFFFFPLHVDVSWAWPTKSFPARVFHKSLLTPKSWKSFLFWVQQGRAPRLAAG